MLNHFEIPQLNNENNLDAIFENYLSEGEHIRSLSKQTIKGYKEVYATFKKIVPEVKSIEDLNPHILQEFFKRLSTRVRKIGSHTQIGVKPSTKSTYYNKLMTFFRWLEDKEYLSEGYLTKSIRRPPEPKYEDERALSKEQVSQIIASIVLNTVNNTFLHKRDMAIVSTLLYTGVRRGELVGLRVQDIDFEKQLVFINHVTSKSKRNRYLPMHSTLNYHLKEYFKELSKRSIKTPYLFISSKSDKALSKEGLRHWVKRYKKLSGINFHFHRFRHTFACSLARKGANLASIMKLLGHTTPRMTERYLRSISTEDGKSYVDRLDF